MRYVLDSSVAFKWFVPETDSDKALRLHDDFLAATLDLLSPDVFPVEVTHALTRAERQGRITTAQGTQLFSDLLQTLPVLVSSLRCCRAPTNSLHNCGSASTTVSISPWRSGKVAISLRQTSAWRP
jgi:predicted nucleic acid-binding protein